MCFCRVGIKLPTVEVRFEKLTVEADCHVGSRALPTLPNAAQNIAESALGLLGIRWAKTTQLTILKDVSGIIKPSRFEASTFYGRDKEIFILSSVGGGSSFSTCNFQEIDIYVNMHD